MDINFRQGSTVSVSITPLVDDGEQSIADLTTLTMRARHSTTNALVTFPLTLRTVENDALLALTTVESAAVPAGDYSFELVGLVTSTGATKEWPSAAYARGSMRVSAPV
jgi:hypothetical protein